MTWNAQFQSGIASIAVITAAMAVVALIETAVPLHTPGRWNRRHLGPNLALTCLTFATNVFFNAALVMMLMRLQSSGVGLLNVVALPPLMSVIATVVWLDFSFYVLHVAMHKIPAFWRFHSVHHSDPAVDVTTTVRQHPGESVLRYAFMAVFAFALGAGPAAFAVYRVWSAVNGLLEHANVRVPLRLDTALSSVVTTPNMHKVHHSRIASETDTNYGNIFSFFDRLLSTFTPSARGTRIAYGLDDHDAPAMQTTAGLLALPFRGTRQSAAPAATATTSPS